MILGITGHRPPGLGCSYNIPNPMYEKVYKALQEKFHELVPSGIISGMAQGTDQWAAWAAMELAIPFVAAIPCDNHESQWPEESQYKYKMLLDKALNSVVVSPGPYSPEKMHIRDRWIVDNSTSLLAVWNGIQRGGTFATIRYAQKQQKSRPDYKIYVIDPSKL